MTLGDKFPVEALPEATWRRVEAAVFDELQARKAASASRRPVARQRWPLVAVAAAALLQVAAAVVFLVVRGDRSQNQGVGSTRLVAHERAVDAMLDDISIHIEPDSVLVAVGSSQTHPLVMIERGAARFSVPPRGTRPSFVVQAGEVHVEVIGTQFRVERLADTARVETYEGVVRVLAAGRATLVRRGETWQAGNASTSAAAASDNEAAAPDEGQRKQDSPAAAEARTPAADGPAPAQSAGQTRRLRNSVEPRPARHRRAAAKPDGVQPDRDRERFERAAKLEASDPKQAIQLYGDLVAQSPTWGANALYAIGRLELELGDRSAALEALQRYTTRYPQGANITDARVLVRDLTARRPASQPEDRAR